MKNEGQPIMKTFFGERPFHAKHPDKGIYGHIFTVLLFALLVITLLLAIVAGTGVYRTLYNMREAIDDTRLSLSLVVNNVRANDAIDAVAEGAGPEGRSLVLIERLENGTYETRIYLYQGHIVEEYSLADTPYTPERATQIVASSMFDFAYEQELLTIMTDQGTADIMLRSAQRGL